MHQAGRLDLSPGVPRRSLLHAAFQEGGDKIRPLLDDAAGRGDCIEGGTQRPVRDLEEERTTVHEGRHMDLDGGVLNGPLRKTHGAAEAIALLV